MDDDGFLVRSPDLVGSSPLLKPFLSNKDVVQKSRNLFIIDTYGLDEKTLRTNHPQIFQRIYDRVYNFRQQSRRPAYKEKWWIFVEPRSDFRKAKESLDRYIATPEVATHRPFIFVDSDVVPDASLYAVASDDAFILGVLSSRIHCIWAVKAGGRMGVGNDPRYQNRICFDPFPFPAATEEQRAAIRDLAEELDTHRKHVLAEHADLTLTGLYNVMEKLKAGEALTDKEQDIHERGLVSVMRHLHERIDATVAEAYGWPADLADQDILARLVALNQERRAEEARGQVRWLRPDYQAPEAKAPAAEQTDLAIEPAIAAKPSSKKPAWPKTVPERIVLVRDILASEPAPIALDSLAGSFKRKPKDGLEDVLSSLLALGLARDAGNGRYVG